VRERTVARDQRSRQLCSQRQEAGLRELIKAAERAGVEGLPPRSRIAVPGAHDGAACAVPGSRLPEAASTRSLRPRRTVVLGIDCGRDLVRSPFPELMPDKRRARAGIVSTPVLRDRAAMIFGGRRSLIC
jgi:hypothetical protein